MEDGTVKRTLTGHTSFVFALKMVGNGDLVSGSSDGSMKIWDVNTGEVKKEIRVNLNVNAFEVLKNGNLVSATDESIIIWN